MTDTPQYTSLTKLSFAVQRTPDRIRDDLKRGRIQATKVGRDWQFTAAQVEDALIYYTDLTQQQRERARVHGS